MSRFSEPQVVIHRSGAPASGDALVGSQFRIPLIYSSDEQTPIDLTGWTLTGLAVLHYCSFTSDGLLTQVGARIQDSSNADFPTETITVEADQDQDTNTGLFKIDIEEDVLPDPLHLIEIDAEELPTLLIYIKLDSADFVIDQARVAVGFRTGIGSYTQWLTSAPRSKVNHLSLERIDWLYQSEAQAKIDGGC